jgi:poly(glycerol-phosphate) alpha-glucosyltransferase
MNSLLQKTKELGIEESVQFIGGQFGANKEACFIDADAFILPSFSEGLPMAVLEAWAYKLPVLITPYCNLPEGVTHKAAIEIETSVESIAEGIQKLKAMDEESLAEIGENGFQLVLNKFTWEQVARSTNNLYQWIMGKGPKPNFVH